MMKPDNDAEHTTGGLLTAKEIAFFDLVTRFRNAETPDAVEQLGDEPGRFIFGP